ncbi:hypothetical protein EV356DRAFT_522614 [Viridothelium virens]|uniref:Rad51-like C-terminal domain-containing protein n=1 Tax=Viridothelium virens TaxID=1048519 RepID=A0A6A6HDW2_VIRVR|nr:hypothetical protein EV356DRAFT_522614 [Viridothelium virens]
MDTSKLNASGYYKIASVHIAIRRILLKIKGFSRVKVENIKKSTPKCQPITSPHGPVQSGKTEVSHVMSIIAQVPKEVGGADAMVAELYAESTFLPEGEHQHKLSNTLFMSSSGNEHRLLIIDGSAACFRMGFQSSGEVAKRQRKTCPGVRALFAGYIPALASETWILLRKGLGEELVNPRENASMPEQEATYQITAGGINDPGKP